MHGELLSALCRACARAGSAGTTTSSTCRRARAAGPCALRPDVVWFGEMPYRMDDIQAALARTDLFVSIGTSGAVYPAAGFVQFAAATAPAPSSSTSSPATAPTSSTSPATAAPATSSRPWVEELLG